MGRAPGVARQTEKAERGDAVFEASILCSKSDGGAGVERQPTCNETLRRAIISMS